MIRLTLDDLLNHGRVGPLALGDPMSKIDAIEGLAAGLDGISRDENDAPLGAYYRFGGFEIHCANWKEGDGLEIFLFVLDPWGTTTELVDGGGCFQIDCLDIRTGQDVEFVLSRLKDFSICRSSRRAPPEMQIYEVGCFGSALFIEEDDSTTSFTQFEVSNRMHRIAGRDAER